MSIPNRGAFRVTEDEGVVSLHHFPSQDEFRFALFHFRAGEGDLVSLAEVHAHVVEKGLRAQVNVGGLRAILYQQMNDLFLAAFWRQFHVLYSSLYLHLRLEIVLGRAWLWGLLGDKRCDEKKREKRR
jgi:hypothetical protein